jgi:putative toxin-antitoxin system antitoxin component (TIGR02293 family)
MPSGALRILHARTRPEGKARRRNQQPESALDLARAVREGFPIEVVDNLRASGRLTVGEVHRVIAPARTLAHRREHGRLNQEQSERALRVAEVLARAEEIFGREKAHLWLRRATAALEGETPLGLLDTQPGVEAVLNLLGRIDHGIAA